MTPQLDAGGMIAQEAVAIGPEETAGELEARLAALGARLAVAAIEEIAGGSALPIIQDKSKVTKAPKLKKEDGLIDWGRSAEQIGWHIRAMQPWPTPYTFLHRAGKEPVRLIINRAAPVATPEIVGWDLSPGTVFARAVPDQRLMIWCGGNTLLEILELQPAGKRRMAAAEFLRGHPLQEGNRFGLDL
jgi:methionyl-tRNA formyltransferase